MNSGVHGLGEANAHTVAFEELAGRAPCSHTNTEVFSFDVEGRITSWRVFRDD